MTKKELKEQLQILLEARIKKTVNRKGKIRKSKTAGRKGRKISGGKVKTVSGQEKRKKRLGNIKKRRTLKKKSSFKKRRSSRFAAAGRKKRKQMGTRDTRR